mmetsp:Transcript_7719/g.14852  ORF Transcript_7719/g.14852 Transcript_7719/m.14852 type:complete len:226 (+) Transcript_7719:226-903(+)
MSSSQRTENMPKALHGTVPKIPWSTSSQNVGTLSEAQSTVCCWLSCEVPFTVALVCLLGSLMDERITNGKPMDRAAMNSRHNRQPLTPRKTSSATAVETNCPKRVPSDETKATLPKTLPRVSDGTMSATMLCVVGGTKDMNTEAHVRNAMKWVAVVERAHASVNTPHAKHPPHRRAFRDIRSPRYPQAGMDTARARLCSRYKVPTSFRDALKSSWNARVIPGKML